MSDSGEANRAEGRQVPHGALETQTDLYREVTSLRRDLAVLDSRISTVDQRQEDHETRLRALDEFRWKLVGIGIVVAAAVGGGAAWVALVLTHH